MKTLNIKYISKFILCLLVVLLTGVALQVLSAETLIRASRSRFETCFPARLTGFVIVSIGIKASPVTNTVCTPDTLLSS